MSTTAAPPGFLHLLMPAARNDENSCKAILSAAILGYPMARLPGLGDRLHPEPHVEISPIGKVEQIKNWLQNKEDDDVVIMVDGTSSVSLNMPSTF